jgi:catechol 2,3-dioxygenase
MFSFFTETELHHMNSQGTPLHAHLFYLQLGSPAPERLARFYEKIFGWVAYSSAAGWICRGPAHYLAFSNGSAGALLSAGYAAKNPEVLPGLAARAADAVVDTSVVDSELFAPGSVALRDPDGNRMVYGLPRFTIPMPGQLQPETLAPPARLQHVVVGSTNVARLVDFYTHTVGLRKSDDVNDEHGATRACFMRTDDEHHSFAVFRTPRNRLDHHCYELKDWNGIRDWADRLAAHGLSIKWGPGRHGPGNNLFIFFHDPDDNWVELSAELEIVGAGRPTGVWRHEERTLNIWGKGHLRS